MKQATLDKMGINSQATQIHTTIAKNLKSSILKSELKDGLEYGAGYCHGAELLGIESYEPNPKEGVFPTYTKVSQIKKKYAFVLCTYVLNVVAEDTRLEILQDIKYLLKDNGRAIVVVRGKADFKSDDKDHIMKKGSTLTFQHGFTFKELAKLCNKAGFNVTNLKGSSAKSIRVEVTT
jgi:hypothetical protein